MSRNLSNTKQDLLDKYLDLFKDEGAMDKKAFLEEMYSLALNDELEKIANGDMLQYFKDHPEKLKEKLGRDKNKSMKKVATTYFHGHTLKNILRHVKEGIPSGNYLANKKRLSGWYASQYGKSGGLLKIDIPKNLKKEYLDTDMINVGVRGYTPSYMSGSFVVKKHIPKNWIKQINQPSEKTIKKFKKDIINEINKKDIINEINKGGIINKFVMGKTAELTEAQKNAGNYKKKHIRYNAMEISIENPAGSIRSGTSSDGKKWESKMNHHYGYIRGTTGKDKDHIDVFINPGTTETEKVFVVNQNNKEGKFDEHKCMLGFDNKKEAEKAYLLNYEKGWKGLGSIVEMPIKSFKEWVYSGKKSKSVKSEEVNMEKEAYVDLIYQNAFIGEFEKIAKSPILSVLGKVWNPGGNTVLAAKNLGRETMGARQAIRGELSGLKSNLQSSVSNLDSLQKTRGLQQATIGRNSNPGMMERFVGGRLGTKSRRIRRLGSAQADLNQTNVNVSRAQGQVSSLTDKTMEMQKKIQPQLDAVRDKYRWKADVIRAREFANVAAKTGIVGGGGYLGYKGYKSYNNRYQGY